MAKEPEDKSEVAKFEASVRDWKKLWNSKAGRPVAILFLVFVLGPLVASSIFTGVGWHRAAEERDELKQIVEKRDQTITNMVARHQDEIRAAETESAEELRAARSERAAELREAIRQRDDLQNIVSPLIRQAAKEFPGEEINQSLKKIIEKLELQVPKNERLASVSAEVRLVVDKIEETGLVRGFGTMIEVGFGEKGQPIALGTAPDYTVRTNGDRSEITATVQFSTDGPAFKKTVGDLCDRAEFLQIFCFRKLSPLLDGDVTLTINGKIHVQLKIPPQPGQNRRFGITDLEPLCKAIFE